MQNISFFSPIGWSGQGCDVKWMNDSKTVCSCNHLNHFAVLMQFDTNSPGHKNDKITEVRYFRVSVSYICKFLFYSLLQTKQVIVNITDLVCFLFVFSVSLPIKERFY